MALTVQPSPSEALDAGVIEKARVRQRRERGIAAVVAIAVAVIAAIVLPSVGGGGGSHPANALVPAEPHAAVLASCAISPVKQLQGAPSQSLLSILGVLRRPATSADALPSSSHFLTHGFPGEQVFVRYIRRARTARADLVCDPRPLQRVRLGRAA